MTSTRKCECTPCACSTVREMSPSKPCDCGECVAYKEELLEQYEAERGTWQRIIEGLQSDLLFCNRISEARSERITVLEKVLVDHGVYPAPVPRGGQQ